MVMMSDDIFIFSQNCQGLANMHKRRDLFYFVKSKITISYVYKIYILKRKWNHMLDLNGDIKSI